jgi:hypothetical protein
MKTHSDPPEGYAMPFSGTCPKFRMIDSQTLRITQITTCLNREFGRSIRPMDGTKFPLDHSALHHSLSFDDRFANRSNA